MCVAGEIGQSCVLGGAAAAFSDKKELLQLFPPVSLAEARAPLQAPLGAQGWPGFL